MIENLDELEQADFWNSQIFQNSFVFMDYNDILFDKAIFSTNYFL